MGLKNTRIHTANMKQSDFENSNLQLSTQMDYTTAVQSADDGKCQILSKHKHETNDKRRSQTRIIKLMRLLTVECQIMKK